MVSFFISYFSVCTKIYVKIHIFDLAPGGYISEMFYNITPQSFKFELKQLLSYFPANPLLFKLHVNQLTHIILRIDLVQMYN